MLNITFTNTKSNSSQAKRFYFDATITEAENVPPQAQHVIQLAYHLAQRDESFTFKTLIDYIDECCEYSGTVFTKSKGGTERIVRYYSKLFQELGFFTTTAPTDEEADEE